jgi:hypothetical protein
MADELMQQGNQFQFDTRSQFLTEVRKQHPGYNTWNDEDLYNGWIQKYPDAASVIRENAEPESPVVKEAKLKNPPPAQWFGRPLNTPVEQLEGGQEYMNLRERQNAGRQGFWEAMTPGMEDIPFLGGGIQAVDSGKVLVTANKIANGEDPSDQELLDLNHFLLENDRQASATLTGKAGNIILGSITFGAELMGAAATLGGLGVEVGGTKAAMSVAKYAALSAVEKASLRMAEQGMKKSALGAIRRNVTASVIDYADKQGFSELSKRMAIKAADAAVMSPIVGLVNVAATQGAQALYTGAVGENGPETQMANVRGIYKALDNKAEPYWESAIMGAVQQWIEGSSEVMGGLLMSPVYAGAEKAIARSATLSKISEIFSAKLNGIRTEALKSGKTRIADLAARSKGLAGVARVLADYMEAHPGINGDSALKFFKKAGYNGIMEEMAEERYGGFLHGLFGTQGDEAGLRNAFDQAIPTTDDAIAELMAFALPMQYVRGVDRLRMALTGSGHISMGHQGEDVLAAQKTTDILEEHKQAKDKVGFELKMAKEAVANQNTHYSKTINWLLDLMALPVTMDFSTTQYGTLDKYIAMEGGTPIVEKYRAIKEKYLREGISGKAMLEEEATAAADAEFTQIMIEARRTFRVEPGTPAEAAAKKAVAGKNIIRTLGGAAVVVQPGQSIDPDLLGEVRAQDVPVIYMSPKDIANKHGVTGVEYSLDDVQRILTTKNREEALKLIGQFHLLGTNSHQVETIGSDVFDVLEKKILAPMRKVVEHQKQSNNTGTQLTLGSRFANAEGVEHVVVSRNEAGNEITLRNRISGALAHVSGESLAKEWKAVERLFILTTAASVADTEENMKVFAKEHQYDSTVLEPLLDEKGEAIKKNGKPLYAFTWGAKTDHVAGKVYINMNASSAHAVEDLFELLYFGANGNNLSKEAQTLMKALTDATGDVLKDPAMAERHPKLVALRKALIASPKEMFFKIGKHLELQYSPEFGFSEKLPFAEELQTLQEALPLMSNLDAKAWRQRYVDEVAKYLRKGWNVHFRNPMANVARKLITPVAVAPAASVNVVEKKEVRKVETAVKAQQEAKAQQAKVPPAPAKKAEPAPAKKVEPAPVAVKEPLKPVAEAKPAAPVQPKEEVTPPPAEEKPVVEEAVVVPPAEEPDAGDILTDEGFIGEEALPKDVLDRLNQTVIPPVAPGPGTPPDSYSAKRADERRYFQSLLPKLMPVMKIKYGDVPADAQILELVSKELGLPYAWSKSMLPYIRSGTMTAPEVEESEKELDVLDARDRLDEHFNPQEPTEDDTEVASDDRNQQKMETVMEERDLLRHVFSWFFGPKTGYKKLNDLMTRYRDVMLNRMARVQKGETLEKSYALMFESADAMNAWITTPTPDNMQEEKILKLLASSFGYEAMRDMGMFYLSRPRYSSLRIIFEKDAKGDLVYRTAPDNAMNQADIYATQARKAINQSDANPRWAKMIRAIKANPHIKFVGGDTVGYKTLASLISSWGSSALQRSVPKDAGLRWRNAVARRDSDYDMGVLSSQLGLPYFATWLSSTPVSAWEHAMLPIAQRSEYTDAILGLRKTLPGFIQQHFSSDKTALMKSVNLSETEQRKLFDGWMNRMGHDSFWGIYTEISEYGVSSNLEKLAKQQQSRKDSAVIDEGAVTPEGARVSSIRAYGPATLQMELRQRNAVRPDEKDPALRDYLMLSSATGVVLSGIEERISWNNKDFSNMDPDEVDEYIKKINESEFMLEGKFFIRMQAGDKQQAFGYLIDTPIPGKDYLANYEVARKWLSSVVAGDAKYWTDKEGKFDPSKFDKRMAFMASRGVRAVPATAGVTRTSPEGVTITKRGWGNNLSVLVVKDGATVSEYPLELQKVLEVDKWTDERKKTTKYPLFDGQVILTDRGHEGAQASMLDGWDSKVFKAGIGGIMPGTNAPIIVKGAMVPRSAMKTLAGPIMSLMERVEKYNVDHPDKPIHAVISSETVKQWQGPIHAMDTSDFKPTDVPTHLVFAQAMLETSNQLHKINTAIQLIANMQTTSAGRAVLEAVYDTQRQAMGEVGELPPAWELIRSEMHDIYAMLGKSDVDAYVKAKSDLADAEKADNEDAARDARNEMARLADVLNMRLKSPYLASMVDRAQSSYVLSKSKRAYAMNGMHAVASAASGSDQVFDSGKRKGKYIAAMVSLHIGAQKKTKDEVRYNTVFGSMKEALYKTAETIRKTGIGGDMVIRKPDGSYIVPLNEVQPKHLRSWELRRMRNPATGEMAVVVPGSLVLVARTPGTGIESYILARLGFDPGEDAGNILFMHQETIRRAGVDYDGDKWAVYAHGLKDGAVDDSMFESKIINAVQAAYDNMPLEDLHNAIDTDAMQNKDAAFKKKVQDILANLKAKGVADPATLNAIEHMVWDSKRALGIWVSSVSMGMLGVTAGGIKAKTPHYDNGAVSWNMVLTSDLKLTRKGDIDVEKWARSDEFLRVVNGTLTNMIVDNPTKPQVDALGINNISANLAILAILFSEPVSSHAEADALMQKITAYMRTPAVKAYVKVKLESKKAGTPSYFKAKETRERMAKILKCSPKDARIKNVQQLGYMASEFFQLSRFVKIGQFPISSAYDYLALKDTENIIDTNAGRNFELGDFAKSLTRKIASTKLDGLMSIFGAAHLINTPLMNQLWAAANDRSIMLSEEAARAEHRGGIPTVAVRPVDAESDEAAPYVDEQQAWQRIETVRLINTFTAPDPMSPSYRPVMSEPRKLGLELTKIIMQLKDAMPDNAFLQSLKAIVHKKVKGYELKYQSATLNDATSGPRIEILQRAAEEIPDIDGWTKDQILRGLAVYDAWERNTSLSSRNGSYAVAIPSRIMDILNRRLASTAAQPLAEEQVMVAENYVRGFYHQLGYRKYEVSWGFALPDATRGLAEYKGYPVIVSTLPGESKVSVAVQTLDTGAKIIRVNKARAPFRDATALTAEMDAAIAEDVAGKTPVVAPAVTPESVSAPTSSPVQPTLQIVHLSFGAPTPQGVFNGHRSGKHVAFVPPSATKSGWVEAKPGSPGALGNPYIANDVAGGKYTRAEATALFEKGLRERVARDPAYAEWLKGLTKVGYYKPTEKDIHLQGAQRVQAELLAGTFGTPAVTPAPIEPVAEVTPAPEVPLAVTPEEETTFSAQRHQEENDLIHKTLNLMAKYNNKPSAALLAPGDRDNYARRIGMALSGDRVAMEFINKMVKYQRKPGTPAADTIDQLWAAHNAAVKRVQDEADRLVDLGENDPDREEPRPDISMSISSYAQIYGKELAELNVIGPGGLHSILIKDQLAISALNGEEVRRYNKLASLFGRNGVLLDDNGKKLADMDVHDRRMVTRFMWAISAMFENSDIRKALDKNATDAQIRNLVDDVEIAYGNPIFNEEGKGKEIAFITLPENREYIYFRYKGDIYKQVRSEFVDPVTDETKVALTYWNQTTGARTSFDGKSKELVELPDAQITETVKDFMKQWKASAAYKKLTVDAKRTPAELDYIPRLREDHVFYKKALKLASYIKSRGYYLPHIMGSGFPTIELQQAKDALKKALSGVQDKSSSATWLPENVYQTKFNTPEKPAPTKEQIDLYQKLTGVKEVDLVRLTMWDMNTMIERELRERQLEIAKEMGSKYDPKEKSNARDLATIKKLNATIGNYKFKEWTARSMPRKLKGTYVEILSDKNQRRTITMPDGRIIHASFKPKNMDAMELRMQYMRDIVAAGMNQAIIHKYLLTPDYDGTPLVLAIPSAFVDEHPLIPDALYREMARRWAKSIGKDIDPHADIRGQLEALARDYSTGYEAQESPYPSVARFLVKKDGETPNLLKHIIQAQAKWMVGDHDMLEYLTFTAQLSKMSSVGWSAFFLMTNIETLIAGTGVKTNIVANIPTAVKEMRRIGNQILKSDPSMSQVLSEMTEGRIEISETTMAGEARGSVDKAYAKLHENVRAMWGEDSAQRVSTGLDFLSGKYFTNIFFGKAGEHAGLFPIFKVYTAMLWAKAEATRRYGEGTTLDQLSRSERIDIYRSISGFINAAVGASPNVLYNMQTPQYRQFAGLVLFAYKWTEAALQVFGAEKLFGALYGPTMSKRSNELVGINAAVMVALVLVALPSLLQSVIWATAGGDDDHPFPLQNEEGKKTYVDITPWARLMPGYKGDPTGRRREYMRWGKQFYEVADGWVTEPGNQFMRKLSQPAKVVVEQVTGRSPGSDWNLDFQGQGLRGWFITSKDDELSFMNSRFGMVLQKFIPMSVLGGLKNPETFIAGAMAPVSKGKSMGRATAELTLVLNSAANENNWKEYKKFPSARGNLEGLGAEILDAAGRNGYDTTKIVNTAKGVVLSRLYKGFTAAMNNGDEEGMDRISKQILRVGGTIKGLQRSMVQRKLQTGQPKELPPEETAAIEEAFNNPGGLTPKTRK